MAQIKRKAAYRSVLKRIDELIHGKMEPSYQLSRKRSLELNIEPGVLLGV